VNIAFGDKNTGNYAALDECNSFKLKDLSGIFFKIWDIL